MIDAKNEKNINSKLFYHHVGQKGSVDFQKTVFRNVHVSILSQTLDGVLREKVIDEVKDCFPEDHFNCWGVPQGANKVIKHLDINDYVLLVQSTSRHPRGKVPALCQVKYRIQSWQPALSERLWGESRFPLIFLFNTEKLGLYWEELCKHLKYEPHNPSGHFNAVADSRLEDFGGVESYIEYLRTNFSE